MMKVHKLNAIFEVCFNKISLDVHVYTLGKAEIKNSQMCQILWILRRGIFYF